MARPSSITSLNNDIMIYICKFLNNEDVLSLMTSNLTFATIFSTSPFFLRKFKLDLNKITSQKHFDNVLIWKIPFKNIAINFNSLQTSQTHLLCKNNKEHVQFLEIKSLILKNFEECYELFSGMQNLTNLSMNDCKLKILNDEALPQIETLQVVSFDKCDENIFKIFRHQQSLEKIIVRNDDYTWNGFCHESFNNLVRNLPKVRWIVMMDQE
ncbi:hypothetical protein ACKWTF_015785 [Chironomus riparius]